VKIAFGQQHLAAARIVPLEAEWGTSSWWVCELVVVQVVAVRPYTLCKLWT